jgi:hypothetical protein
VSERLLGEAAEDDVPDGCPNGFFSKASPQNCNALIEE